MSWFRRERKTAPAAARGSLEIREPWTRTASAGALQAGGFMTITNGGTEPDRLMAANSPAAGSIEIHAIKVVGAGVRMQARQDGLAIPPGITLTLKPRGYHLLLNELKAPLQTGGRLPVTLTFERAGEINIDLSVREPGPIGGGALG